MQTLEPGACMCTTPAAVAHPAQHQAPVPAAGQPLACRTMAPMVCVSHLQVQRNLSNALKLTLQDAVWHASVCHSLPHARAVRHWYSIA